MTKEEQFYYDEAVKLFTKYIMKYGKEIIEEQKQKEQNNNDDYER